MRIHRTLGCCPSPTPCWFLVRMYLCGYVACSARAPAQHCWMCCANERNIVGPRFDDRETIEMLAVVGSEVWPVSNFIQQLPTSRNNTQQHTTWFANAHNMLGPTMLRAFARALKNHKKKRKTIQMVMVDEHFYRIHLNAFAGRFVSKRSKTTRQKWAFATFMVISHVFVT